MDSIQLAINRMLSQKDRRMLPETPKDDDISWHDYDPSAKGFCEAIICQAIDIKYHHAAITS